MKPYKLFTILSLAGLYPASSRALMDLLKFEPNPENLDLWKALNRFTG